MSRQRLGDTLVSLGILTAERLTEALAIQDRSEKRLGEILIERGWVTEAQFVQVLANQLSVPWVNLHHIDFSRQLLSHLPKEIAEKYRAVPVYVRNVRNQGEVLYIALDDPTNEEALLAVATAARLPVKAMVSAPSDIRAALRAYYGVDIPDLTPKPQPTIPAVSAPPPPPKEKPKADLTSGVSSGEANVEPAPVKPTGKSKSNPPQRRKPKMVTLTLLDGTKVTLPSPGKTKTARTDEDRLTARDLLAALHAESHGADVTDVLGDVRWQTLFSALLSTLLKKHVIADWEFVEELKKLEGK